MCSWQERASGKANIYDYINALQKLGFAGFLAESFHPQFQRECIDRGIPVIAYPDLPSKVRSGDYLELDLTTGKGILLNRSVAISAGPTPPLFLSILAAGGLKPYTLQKLASGSRSVLPSDNSKASEHARRNG